jgi:RNA polymerase-binding protein DksA
VVKSALKTHHSSKNSPKHAGKKSGGKVNKLKSSKPAKLIVAKPKAHTKVSPEPVNHRLVSRLGGKVKSENRRQFKPLASIDMKANIPSPVATNLKPRKNQAGLLTRELEHFRDLLLEKRREIVGDMSSMEREALRSGSGSNLSTLPIHMADMGTDNYEQEFTLGLVEKDRNLLREINNALAKIQNGAFGICEGTGKPIAKPRLEAQPWARFSIEFARKIEKGVMGTR